MMWITYIPQYQVVQTHIHINQLRVQLLLHLGIVGFIFFSFNSEIILHFTSKYRNTRPTYVHCFVKKTFSKLEMNKFLNEFLLKMRFTKKKHKYLTVVTTISSVVIINERTKRLKSENPPR